MIALDSFSFVNLGPPPSTGSDGDFDTLFSLGSLTDTYLEKVAPRGGRGIDRIGTDSFELQRATQLQIASSKATAGSYHFAPYLEKLILRGAHRPPRRLAVPTLRDRAVLQQLKLFLQGPFAGSIERRLPNEFIRKVKSFAAAADVSSLGVIRTDISSFYDEIRHDQLLAIIASRITSKRACDLVRRAVRNPTLPAHTSRDARRGAGNRCGVPQGLPVSNLLAAAYLEEFDAELKSVSELYLRYVDDILVVAPLDSLEALNSLMATRLKDLGLRLNAEKTYSGPLSNRFDYLGYSFELPGASVRKASVERFLRGIAARFSAYQHRSLQGGHPKWLSPDQRRQAFIEELNEKITGAISGTHRYGWLFYYSEIDDLALLHKLDAVIGRMFRRLPDFRGTSLTSLKRLSRAYFEVKYSPTGGYVHDYNALSTSAEQLAFLVRRGAVDQANVSSMSVEEIGRLFQRERDRRLAGLDRDIGFLY
ncbi:MAG TPA: reverse transcriptase domain-containing protein [Gemmatimonadales bacterium]